MTRKEFEKAVEAARPALVKVAWRAVNKDDAEDLAQDAVLVALSRPDWAGVENVEKWLYKIVFNLQQTHQQTAARRAKIAPTSPIPTDEEGDCEMGLIGDFDILDVLIERENELEKEAETARQYEAIMEAIDRAGLSAQQSLVFCARAAGKGNDQIALELGVSADSVRATFSAAVQKIRATLGVEKVKGESK